MTHIVKVRPPLYHKLFWAMMLTILMLATALVVDEKLMWDQVYRLDRDVRTVMERGPVLVMPKPAVVYVDRFIAPRKAARHAHKPCAGQIIFSPQPQNIISPWQMNLVNPVGNLTSSEPQPITSLPLPEGGTN